VELAIPDHKNDNFWIKLLKKGIDKYFEKTEGIGDS
jgi:hypothetical protein